MVHPQVADGGRWPPNMEGSSRGQPTGGGPPAWGLDRELTTTHRKTFKFVTLTINSLGPGWILWQNTQALKNRYKIWHLECQEPLQDRFTDDSSVGVGGA
jgi:hypothetical protein